MSVSCQLLDLSCYNEIDFTFNESDFFSICLHARTKIKNWWWYAQYLTHTWFFWSILKQVVEAKIKCWITKIYKTIKEHKNRTLYLHESANVLNHLTIMQLFDKFFTVILFTYLWGKMKFSYQSTLLEWTLRGQLPLLWYRPCKALSSRFLAILLKGWHTFETVNNTHFMFWNKYTSSLAFTLRFFSLSETFWSSWFTPRFPGLGFPSK